jgi:hypothetical protein
MQLFAEDPDQEYQILKEKGYDGNLNDMQYKYLGDQGYTSGALADRMLAYFQAEFGYFSWQQYAATEFDLTTPTKSWLLNSGLWDDTEYWRDSADWTTLNTTATVDISGYDYTQDPATDTYLVYLTLSDVTGITTGLYLTFSGITGAGSLYNFIGEDGVVLDFRTLEGQPLQVSEVTGSVVTVGGSLGFDTSEEFEVLDSDGSDLGTEPQVTYTYQ